MPGPCDPDGAGGRKLASGGRRIPQADPFLPQFVVEGTTRSAALEASRGLFDQLTAGVRPVVGRSGIRAEPGEERPTGAARGRACGACASAMGAACVCACVCRAGSAISACAEDQAYMYGCRSEYIYMYIYTHHPLPAYGAGVLLPTWHRPDFFTWSSCRAMTSRLSSNRGDEGSRLRARRSGAGDRGRGEHAARGGYVRGDGARFWGADGSAHLAWAGPSATDDCGAGRTLNFTTPRNRGGPTHGCAPTSAGEYM